MIDDLTANDNQFILPRDRDFFLTRDGMFFCVTGYLHPPDRYTAYLKYSPDPDGKWRGSETSYRRELPYYHVENVAETIRYLEKNYPDYVSDCWVRDIRFSMVPRQAVTRYFQPQPRLKEILTNPQDELEEQTRDLAMEIASLAGISTDDLGVSGSILIGLHDPAFSDIDLMIYGRENAQRVRRMLRESWSDGRVSAGAHIRRPDQDFIDDWAEDVSRHFSLSREECRFIFSRRWNYAFWDTRYFSLHPTRVMGEITEQYGDHIYRGLGSARISATVTRTEDAFFQPAIYGITDVQVLDGEPEASKAVQVVSYEGLYCDIADVGDVVEVQGKLEAVDGQPFQLVVGTFQLMGSGYIKSLAMAG